MPKKQSYNPLVKNDENGLPSFVSPNRKTYRQFLANGLETERVCGPRAENPIKNELSKHKKELAREHGSKTGQLKKKHIRREFVKVQLAALNESIQKQEESKLKLEKIKSEGIGHD